MMEVIKYYLILFSVNQIYWSLGISRIFLYKYIYSLR